MNNGGEAAEMIVRLYLEGFEEVVKLTGTGIKNLVPLLATTLKQESKTKGKERLSKMIKSGSPLKVFTFKNKDLKKFTEQAKRYGVLYTVLRDKNSNDPNATVDVIARAEDASKIQRIADRFEFSTVDKASIVKEVEKKKADREEVQVEKPVKSKEDIVVEEAMAPPPEKKENAHENPDAAKTDKNPPSRRSSGRQDTNTDKGNSKSDGKKPSVKEKLERYKAEHAAGQKKEAERYQPKHTQEKKTPSKNRQTKHKQPKKKQKAKHYKSKER